MSGENYFEGLFIIGYGLGGGFGGANIFEVIQVDTLEEAETEAWKRCCEEYDTYAGSQGLRTIEKIVEEDGLEEKEAEQAFAEERESWLDYSAAPYTKEYEKEVKGYHYNNPYEEITGKIN